MLRNFEWDVVFKNLGDSQKNPWHDTFTGLILQWGVLKGRRWNFMSWKGPTKPGWEWAMLSGNQPAWQKCNSWFLQSKTESNALKFTLFTSLSDGWWTWLRWGGGACQAAGHSLHPALATVSVLPLPSPAVKVWFNALRCQQPGC